MESMESAIDAPMEVNGVKGINIVNYFYLKSHWNLYRFYVTLLSMVVLDLYFR